jgi:hypothetical protein
LGKALSIDQNIKGNAPATGYGTGAGLILLTSQETAPPSGAASSSASTPATTSAARKVRPFQIKVASGALHKSSPENKIVEQLYP